MEDPGGTANLQTSQTTSPSEKLKSLRHKSKTTTPKQRNQSKYRRTVYYMLPSFSPCRKIHKKRQKRRRNSNSSRSSYSSSVNSRSNSKNSSNKNTRNNSKRNSKNSSKLNSLNNSDNSDNDSSSNYSNSGNIFSCHAKRNHKTKNSQVLTLRRKSNSGNDLEHVDLENDEISDDDQIIMVEVRTVSPKQLRRQQSHSANQGNAIKYTTSVKQLSTKTNFHKNNSSPKQLLKRKSGRQTVPNKISSINTSKVQPSVQKSSLLEDCVSDEDSSDIFYPSLEEILEKYDNKEELEGEIDEILEVNSAHEMNVKQATMEVSEEKVVTPWLPPQPAQIVPVSRCMLPNMEINDPTACVWWSRGFTYGDPICNADELTLPIPQVTIKNTINVDPVATTYRRSFLAREHTNFIGWDYTLGPMIMSVVTEKCPNTGSDLFRVLLRTKNTSNLRVFDSTKLKEKKMVKSEVKTGNNSDSKHSDSKNSDSKNSDSKNSSNSTKSLTIDDNASDNSSGIGVSSAKPSSTSSSEKYRKNVQDNAKTGSQANKHKHQQKPNINLRNKTTSHGKVARLFQNFNYSPTKWSKEMLGRDMNISKWYPVLCLNAWQRILSYDEHQLSYQHKFGIIYQKARQTNETDILANNSESSAFSEFLNQIGEVVQLKGFKGFRGGLDISANNTGSRSLYRVFNERHIMFHVSTMLPFNTRDSQQVQRKRFIGNDLVTVVFQDSATPFSPTLLKTNYIHCYIVLQPIESCTPRVRYKMSICSREGVPDFGPALPEPPIFEPGEYFQKFLLCKLINAEIACSQAGRFGKLNDRTRTSLLFSLYDDLKKSTENLCGVKIDNGTGVTKGMDHKAGKSPRTVQRDLISANHSKFFDALRIFRGNKKNQENSMPETEESSIDLSQNGSINDKDKSEKSEKKKKKKKKKN